MCEDTTPIAQWGVTDADEPLAPALNDIDTESKRKQEKISNRERTTNINLKWIYGGGNFRGLTLVGIFCYPIFLEAIKSRWNASATNVRCCYNRLVDFCNSQYRCPPNYYIETSVP